MENKLTIAQKLNESVFKVIGADGLIGFEKAYLIANAAGELKNLLTTEYMKPIMALQGNRLGFKTDKDSSGGYKDDEVKNCLIEAVLTGVQPFGNQFNIIAGNCYITKEGFGYLLNNYKGLSYQTIPQLPRINPAETSAAIVVKVKWSLNGISGEQDIDIPIKMNKFMGTDAVIGKATRKARAWLFNTINGTEIADGDIADLDSKSIRVQPVEKTDQQHEIDRFTALVESCTTPEELQAFEKDADTEDKKTIYSQKRNQLLA